MIARADCDSWSCDDCAQRMAEHWGLRAALGAAAIIRRGESLDFVTITSHEKLADFASTERVWRSAWAKLYNALKRRKAGLEYMIVPEKHEDGRMHVHALWNAGVTKRWLKDNARARGMGYEVKIGEVKSEDNAGRYVSKYLGKNMGEEYPKRFRRVRTSHNWAKIPEANSETSALEWEYVGTNGALQMVYEQAQEKEMTLIDIRTGEIFDDVDLGTIIYA